MEKIYLAQLELGNYLLTAWGETESAARQAIEKEWHKANAEGWNTDINGWDFSSYVDQYGMRVTEIEEGVTVWQ